MSVAVLDELTDARRLEAITPVFSWRERVSRAFETAAKVPTLGSVTKRELAQRTEASVEHRLPCRAFHRAIKAAQSVGSRDSRLFDVAF